jgi:hypothetical protein
MEQSEQDGNGMDERRRPWERDVAGAATEGKRASDRGSDKRLIFFYFGLPPVSWYPRLLVSTLLGEDKDTLPKASLMPSV